MTTKSLELDPKGKIKVRYFRLRNRLKEKAGTGQHREPGNFAMKALEQAMAELDKFAEDYPDWVQGQVRELYDVLKKARDKDDTRRSIEFKRINEIAHDMRGQGGTFGYPLVTTVADSLYKLTGTRALTSESHLEIVKSHIDTMNAVIKERVEGDGGILGRELLTALEKAIEKFS
ncbi:MAG: hypothetical protein RID42_08555 [Alphaproteobacteria bacterium]|jgi:hypothetical protein